eukprot:CAMPEP_0170543622 /NCGR_PEP_ID=MMETSP0211-20121228/2677_1 /TAXON_ID=311385 /ORGANISM="Pseudokeronopsis sp., Strain OXSARD2" /LENGTH=163 /DNA_ID=CAMNT_0010847049 /DNA_START=26 /DNA_END=514 /DNA_ORIENTATION=+
MESMDNYLGEPPKLVYGRQRSLSDANGMDIRLKDPKAMNEQEKVTWKVAVQREYEDTNEYLNGEEGDALGRELPEPADDPSTQDMFDTYNLAIEKINTAAQVRLGAFPKSKGLLEVDKNYMKARNQSARGERSNSRGKKIELEDLDKEKKFIKNKNVTNMGPW